MKEDKIKVNFFQRRPRDGFNFSIESIFDSVKIRLADRIFVKTFISKCYNDGYYSKLVNIIEAFFRQGNDINHITGETHFLNLLMNKRRVVLTIHDCGMLQRKKGIKKKIVQWLYLSAPVKKAKLVTANSLFTKSEIMRFTSLKSENIRVIPVAVDPCYVSSTKLFNKKKPVILQVGTGYNKNLLRLIEAVKDINCELVIIGKLSDEQLQALKDNNIDFRNEYNVTNDSMLEKYKESDLLAFISTHEGFGMPIVEANAVERVVITSNISSMPEIAGNAAFFVDPFDVGSIRTGILKIINDDLLRDKLISNGRINKEKFNADTIADQYFEIYQEVAENNNI